MSEGTNARETTADAAECCALNDLQAVAPAGRHGTHGAVTERDASQPVVIFICHAFLRHSMLVTGSLRSERFST